MSAVDASELAELTLVDAAEGLRRRTFSSLELTDACLARIERAQPRLNCFISIDPERAREQARRADAAHGDGLLAGVPLAHKDMFYRRGRISTCGSKIRRDVTADVTATVLERLDGAGALEIGTLNMSEFAAGATGHNVHFDDCENPWKAGYAPGGSSSGAGAAVAGRLVFAALGSDTGGSVRLPAYFCGVAGMRPTYGRVSRFGAMPRSWSADAVGPLARTVRDVARLLRVIAGADVNDPTSEQVAVPDYETTIENSIQGLRIGRPTNFFYDELDDEQRHRVRRLMRLIGLEAIYQAPRTSVPHPMHRIYPYLLKGMAIDQPNRVWCADITYIPVQRGFLYLVAIMDWAPRHVLSWRPTRAHFSASCCSKRAMISGPPT